MTSKKNTINKEGKTLKKEKHVTKLVIKTNTRKAWKKTKGKIFEHAISRSKSFIHQGR